MTTRTSSDSLDTVLRQSIDATEQTDLKPHVSFHPWHHVPIGDGSPYSAAINGDADEHSASQFRKRAPVLIAAILITLLTLWTTVATLSSHQLRTQPPIDEELPCYCGKTIAEARSLGCIYVAMASAWLPPQCRDDALAADFESAGPGPNGTWSYFADMEMAVEMSPEQVAALAGTEKVYYTTWEWHVVHCLFYWRKLHRTQTAKGLTIEPRFNSDAHIHHCAKLILTRGELINKTRSGMDLGNEPVQVEMLTSRVSWADLSDGKGDF